MFYSPKYILDGRNSDLSDTFKLNIYFVQTSFYSNKYTITFLIFFKNDLVLLNIKIFNLRND